MRTTIDIPERLLKEAKARAALDGVRLKDFVAQALRVALFGAPSPGEAAARSQRKVSGQKQLRLSAGCIFPLLKGSCGPLMDELASGSASSLLAEEDVEHELSRGR